MGKLFGTDGIRGVVNAGLDAELAYKVGLAAAQVLGDETGKKPLVAIGKDTRISSDLLEGALVAGLCSAGADVLHLGVVPTPAVAWITVDRGADAGIVISASHNPFEHNGIKIFNGQGFKLSDELEGRIEDIVLSGAQVPRATHEHIGKVLYTEDRARDDYIDHLAATVGNQLSGLRILVDCANGAASSTAPQLFDRFDDLHCDIINADPDGVNINTNCGSTHLDSLAAMVKAGGYDVGIAFDGDADRCLAVSEEGTPIDGDQIMAACGRFLKEQGRLSGDTIVATVMSNIGLHRFGADNGIQVVCTDVGDRNVLERMLRDGFVLGGEQSGHTIFLEHSTTGDGQLTALQFLHILQKSGLRASQLVGDCRQYPQVLVNVAVTDNAQKQRIMSSQALKEAISAREAALSGNGRILVRPSGTEALIRVMVEAETVEGAAGCAEELANLIKTL
ncbi:MAG TPA: phosphoglucosamine mutase [Candidatus Intestinimonas pullistercoris]|uniref:Phosphoglucosamine mutase n=1 Tax=Candidatus Intestinimonas pullistercoris TaxID=2838623 RepID=A0A9D2NZP0_9FIRM|nr:phosphoglucosamine mutase [uncultured Intestinimonas sp.]HJC41676.1 phosphoglucosamine mutase [Candidatus Intestinimonas pullistercoris]